MGVAVLLGAGWSGSMATLRAQEPKGPDASSSSFNTGVMCNMADVLSFKKGRSSYMILMSC